MPKLPRRHRVSGPLLPKARRRRPVTAFERAQALVAEWDADLGVELPEHARLVDVHTHLGHDIDGTSGRYEELTGVLDRYGFETAFVFSMDEHDREPAFTV